MLRSMAIICLLSAFIILPVDGVRTHIVDDDDFAQFSTIGEAVTAASDGDTILVKPGTYQEEVVLEKALTIMVPPGESEPSLLDGSGLTVGIKVLADGCTIEGLTISNYQGPGIYLASNGNTVRKNQFYDDLLGIFLKESSENVLDRNQEWRSQETGIALWQGSNGNRITGNDARGCIIGILLSDVADNVVTDSLSRGCVLGLNLTGSQGNEISGYQVLDGYIGMMILEAEGNSFNGCQIINNTEGLIIAAGSATSLMNSIISDIGSVAISMTDSIGCQILNNRIERCEGGFDIGYSSGNRLEGNNLTDVTFGLYIDGPSEESFDNEIGQSNQIDGVPIIYSYGESDQVVRGIEASHITLAYCRNCTVEENVITNDLIMLFGCSEGRIAGNIIESCIGGIRLQDSWDNLLAGNAAKDNFGTGLFLNNSSYNQVEENNLSENGINGIALIYNSNNNAIVSNVIDANREAGIRMNYSDGNTIEANDIGQNLMRGLWMEASDENTVTENTISKSPMGAYLYNCSKNEIFHNNFLENADQAMDQLGENSWDMGNVTGGNYWSDHSCKGDPCLGLPRLIKGPAIDGHPFSTMDAWEQPKASSAGPE